MPSPTVLKNIIRVQSLHPDTRNYRDRIFAAGGTIGNADIQAIDRLLVRAAYRNGWRQFVLDCSPFAGDNLAAALVKLWHPSGIASTLTNVNFVAGDYTRSGGLNPGVSNSTKYCNTGFNPSTQGITTASGHLSIYSRTDSIGDFLDIGSYTAGSENSWQLITRYTGSVFAYDQFSYVTGRATTTSTSSAGFFLGSRISTTDIRAYRNAVQVASSNTVANAAPNSNIFLFCRSSGGSPQLYSNRTLSFYSIGLGVPVDVQAAMYQDVLNLQTYFGRAV